MSVTDQSRETAVEELYAAYAAAPVLAELAHGRCLVPPSGPLDSPFMVVGEAPGEQEEKQGRPFAGPSGRLLQELFAQAGIPWELCYVTNTVCWRPPGNRTPYPFQVQASEDRLRREIELVDPVVVVTAGSVAWRGVSWGRFGAFEKARWQWTQLDGRRLLAVPHPSAILRISDPVEQRNWKQATVDALKLALA